MAMSTSCLTRSTRSRLPTSSISATVRCPTMADNEQEKQPARQSSLAIALLAGGILLFALSFVWPGQSPSRAAWTTQQAKAYDAASIKLHSLSQETVATAGSNNAKALRAKVEQAEAEYK